MVANLDLAPRTSRSAPRSLERRMPRRRTALWATAVLAALSAVGMLAQVYLIAGVMFGEAWLELHSDLGKIVHLGYLLTFGAAVLAVAPDWRWLLWPSVLAALGSMQAFMAGEFDIPLLAWGLDLSQGNGALHALHGALVPVVFAVAIIIAWRAWTALGIGTRSQAPAPADTLEPSGLVADPKLFALLAAVFGAGPALAIGMLVAAYLVGAR
jgi:hypothetical protein